MKPLQETGLGLNNLENGSIRNRENLQYYKLADSVSMRLLMRSDGKCSNVHAPSHRLKLYSTFRQNPIFLKNQDMKKLSTLYRCTGRSLTNCTQNNNTLFVNSNTAISNKNMQESSLGLSFIHYVYNIIDLYNKREHYKYLFYV